MNEEIKTEHESYDKYDDFEDIASVDLKNFKVSADLDKYATSIGKKTGINNVSRINNSSSVGYGGFDKYTGSKSGLDDDIVEEGKV